MEFTTSYCPNPQCTHYGQRGFGAHLVCRGADCGIPRLLCTRCEGTFSARQGTAYFGVRAEEPNYTIAMRALAEGNSLRGTGRIVEIDKDTVCDWLDRAGRHCRAVTTYLFDTLHITECQVDELWSFVRKKEAPHSIGLRGKQIVSQPEGNAPPDFPLRHQGGALDLPQKNVNSINALKFYH